MSALNSRLERGLDAACRGDLTIAQAALDEVARAPGQTTPISGLSPEAEAQFYELVGRVALLAGAADCACGDQALASGPGGHFVEESDSGRVEVARSERTLRLSPGDDSETFVTLQTYRTEVRLEPGAEISDEAEAELGWAVREDRGWSECRVEEVRVVRTTLRYADRIEAEAPPLLSDAERPEPDSDE